MEAERAKRIKELQKEKDVVILAHYYVDGAVQEIADYVGDSFYLEQGCDKGAAEDDSVCRSDVYGRECEDLKPG